MLVGLITRSVTVKTLALAVSINAGSARTPRRGEAPRAYDDGGQVIQATTMSWVLPVCCYFTSCTISEKLTHYFSLLSPL
jgi:hypothetical protein